MEEAEHMNKVGRFEVPHAVLVENPDVMLKIMATVIVIGCALSRDKHAVLEYRAISPMFDDVEPGEDLPVYEANYDEEKDEVTWNKA